MMQEEALVHLADPYSTFGRAMTQEICDVFRVPFPEHLVRTWRNRQEAWYKHDTAATLDGPGEGVFSSELCCWVASCLGILSAANSGWKQQQEQCALELKKKFGLSS